MKKISKENMIKINSMLDEDNAKWNMREKLIMYKALHDKYGDEINELIAKNIGKRTENTFKEISKILDDNSLEMFMKLLFDPLPSMGWKVESKDENGKFYRKVTYCPKCEMAKELGAEKLMYLLACCTDYYSSKGFNENIIFERNTTLMQGGPCCDFCFYLKSNKQK